MNYCCGNSSVGRAQPCQGWGREFESRFPLKPKSTQERCRNGGIGRHEGLKIPWPVMAVRQTECKDNTNYWNSQDNCCFFIHLVLFFAISYTNTPY